MGGTLTAVVGNSRAQNYEIAAVLNVPLLHVCTSVS